MCVNTRSSQPKCATRRYDAARSTRTAHSSCDTLSRRDGTCSVAVLMVDLLLGEVRLACLPAFYRRTSRGAIAAARDQFDYLRCASYAPSDVLILRSIRS